MSRTCWTSGRDRGDADLGEPRGSRGSTNGRSNLPRGLPLRDKWDLIPSDTGVLVTHGPPYGYLDCAERPVRLDADDGIDVEHVGCEELRSALDRVQPKLHVFGDIHDGYGQVGPRRHDPRQRPNCDAGYKPVNSPVVVDLP